jgi:hypothetical protein
MLKNPQDNTIIIKDVEFLLLASEFPFIIIQQCPYVYMLPSGPQATISPLAGIKKQAD